LNALTPVARSIVWLHDVEGYTHGEIARLFGRTVSFSKSQLARAHEELRDLLEPQSGALACTPLSRT
jgi:RNA polymerase sigma-70 factor (ECF subfamily)